MSLYKVKATFTTSSLSYHPTALQNTLKYDGLSNAVTGKSNSDILDLNGTLSSTAKGSGFSTPQIIAITSSGNDKTANVTFKIDGTSDGSTPVSQTIDAVNQGTAFTTTLFKTISKITVGGGNTTGSVSSGIGSILEETSHTAGQSVTYTVKATNIPKGISPLVVNLNTSGVTAFFDYGESFQANSREFLVDDEKISILSSNTVNGALSLVGNSTVTLTSPHFITIESAADDRSNYFLIKGQTSSSSTDQEWVQGTNGGSAISTKAFKTITAIEVVNGNSSTTHATSAGKLKAGVTDENRKYTVTVVAPQDSTDELNPHIVAISHNITQNGSVATAYNNEIANKSITIQDVNLPISNDSIIKTDKNTNYTFKASDFKYSDADGDSIKKIKITQLEAKGDLEFNGTDLTLNQEINIGNIGQLVFKPANNQTFTVNKNLSSSSNYSIDGTNDPTLTLYKGYTYTFDMVGNGHPFYLKSTSSTSGTANEFTSGVSRTGTSDSGSNGDKLVFTVPQNAPDTLWYQCSLHSGMLGKLNILDASGSGYGTFKFQVNDGLNYSASAANMKVNVGDSVETTIKYFAQNKTGTPTDQVIKSKTLVIKNSSGNEVHSGSYTTNNNGIVDLLGISDGSYSMNYTITDSVRDQAINALDVSAVLDISSGLNSSATSEQKVLADTNGDGQINALDVSKVLDMSSGLDNTQATVFLRDATKSDPFTDKTINIVSGNDLNLKAFLMGDMNGSYADILAT